MKVVLSILVLLYCTAQVQSLTCFECPAGTADETTCTNTIVCPDGQTCFSIYTGSEAQLRCYTCDKVNDETTCAVNVCDLLDDTCKNTYEKTGTEAQLRCYTCDKVNDETTCAVNVCDLLDDTCKNTYEKTGTADALLCYTCDKQSVETACTAITACGPASGKCSSVYETAADGTITVTKGCEASRGACVTGTVGNKRTACCDTDLCNVPKLSCLTCSATTDETVCTSKACDVTNTFCDSVYDISKMPPTVVKKCAAACSAKTATTETKCCSTSDCNADALLCYTCDKQSVETACTAITACGPASGKCSSVYETAADVPKLSCLTCSATTDETVCTSKACDVTNTFCDSVYDISKTPPTVVKKCAAACSAKTATTETKCCSTSDCNADALLCYTCDKQSVETACTAITACGPASGKCSSVYETAADGTTVTKGCDGTCANLDDLSKRRTCCTTDLCNEPKLSCYTCSGLADEKQCTTVTACSATNKFCKTIRGSIAETSLLQDNEFHTTALTESVVSDTIHAIMRVATLYHGLLVLAFIGLCDTIFVMLAPNILRVGTKENVLLESHDFSGVIEAQIVVLSFPEKSHELYRGTVTLNSNNNYQALKTIEISANQLQRNPREKQYVYLQAISPNFFVEHVVMVSFHSGYIFTQTDKPIYNPSETVHIRTFAMTQALASTNNSVTIMIKNPDNIVFEEVTRVASSGIISYSYKLPEVVNVGIWKVISKYHQKESEFVSEFEVKEYVLPSFEVQLNPQKKFFHVDDDELQVTIVARYLYGKDVVGVAYVVFGVIVNGTKKSIQSSPQRVDVSGTGTVSLLKSDIESITTTGNIRDLVDYSIYIRATVLTSTGSDLVQAETSGLKIVTSPYKILFTKTSKYFKPGMPFDVLVFVTDPDGTPARGIPVKVTPEESHGVTQSNGLARLVVNTKGGIQELKITVKTVDQNIQDNQQASNEMTAYPYIPKNKDFKNYLYINIRAAEKSPGEDLHFEINLQNDDSAVKSEIEYFSYLVKTVDQNIQDNQQASNEMTAYPYIPKNKDFKNYLYINIRAAEKSPGEDLHFEINLQNDDSAVKNDIEYFSYLVINKGKIIQTGRKKRDVGQIVIAMSLTITKAMVPSFRIVAYYYVKKGGQEELVSDSVWVDVTDSCIGELLVEPYRSTDVGKIYRPGNSFELKISGDPGAKVGLVAVDKAVFLLNNKNKLTQSKIWDVIEKDDLGCTPGGGGNSMGVFTDAGLQVKTNLDIATQPRTASKYKDETQNKCCRDGMNDIPMDYCCEKRAQYITAGDECIKAFLHCCTEISKRKKEMHTGTLELSRSEESDMVSDDDVRIRTHFDESWLWQVETLSWDTKGNRLSSAKVKGTLKDSITEWEILAISISPDKGICVAKPFDLIARMEFFIDLKLPYSVVRNEQVEIKAVLYNYGSDQLKPEGTLIKKHIQTVILNPAAARDAKQVVSFGKINLNSVVPDTKPQTFIDIRGELLAETIDHSIDGNILAHLIRMPGGCVEQNMASITAPVIATHYLDKSYQWESAGLERRQQAIKFIQQGYQNQLAYRKPDGSYPPYRRMESSTCLRNSIDKSVLFLEGELHGLQRPYSAAISSYALALARNGNRGNNLKEYLMRFASADKTHWPEPASREYTLEATAYALLALVTIGEKQSVVPIVEWLLPQMRSGGGFGTTQTTMITFQALAAYMEAVPQERDVDLDVAITLSGRSKDVSWKFVPSNVYVAKSQRANIDQNITVTASGKGKGIMTVVYKVRVEEIDLSKGYDEYTMEIVEVIKQGGMGTIYVKINDADDSIYVISGFDKVTGTDGCIVEPIIGYVGADGCIVEPIIGYVGTDGCIVEPIIGYVGADGCIVEPIIGYVGTDGCIVEPIIGYVGTDGCIVEPIIGYVGTDGCIVEPIIGYVGTDGCIVEPIIGYVGTDGCIVEPIIGYVGTDGCIVEPIIGYVGTDGCIVEPIIGYVGTDGCIVEPIIGYVGTDGCIVEPIIGYVGTDGCIVEPIIGYVGTDGCIVEPIIGYVGTDGCIVEPIIGYVGTDGCIVEPIIGYVGTDGCIVEPIIGYVGGDGCRVEQIIGYVGGDTV
ncbi:UNVERIFIED_CONTAM: hypothetical protein FKN15_036377 [Acipenser sinensis]